MSETSGSMDVRSDNSTPPVTNTSKTDTPIPITASVSDSAATPAVGGVRSAASGDRMISGIDLIDYGAGGLMPNHVYLVKGAGGVGKSILGLQFLTRGLEHQEPG